MTDFDSAPQAEAEAASGALARLVVIDLSRALAGPHAALAGPHAAMMLGDLGARVIKVEAPGSGEVETTRLLHNLPSTLNAHEASVLAWLDETEGVHGN